MTDANKRALWLFVLLAAVVIFLEFLARRKPAVLESPPQEDFNAPYYWPNGIYPGVQNMNGALSPFESTVNVYLENPALAGLANQYIPMFGFVGMTAVKG